MIHWRRSKYEQYKSLEVAVSNTHGWLGVTSVDEVTAEMAEEARELEVHPEAVSELPQFHGGKKKNLNGWPKKRFIEMEPIPGKDVVNSVEMTTRRFRIIFTEKAAAGF